MRIPDLEYMITEEIEQRSHGLCINCGMSERFHVKIYEKILTNSSAWVLACIHKFADRPARYESA